MVLDAVSNFVRGNTDAAVGTDDTTVSVADASIFPDPATDGEFNVVIWDVDNFPRPDQDGDVEIMRVTERDTTADELTVTRAQEMTSAAAHPEGSAIHLSPTAKMFSDIESTFGDFWDAGTQELTADVNNTNTTTEALEADSQIINNQADSLHGDNIEQEIQPNTQTQIQFAVEDSNELGGASATDDSITIQTDGLYYIEFGIQARSDNISEVDFFSIRSGSNTIVEAATKDGLSINGYKLASGVRSLNAADEIFPRILLKTSDGNVATIRNREIIKFNVVRLG